MATLPRARNKASIDYRLLCALRGTIASDGTRMTILQSDISRWHISRLRIQLLKVVEHASPWNHRHLARVRVAVNPDPAAIALPAE